MTSDSATADAKRLHPIRASGTLALILLFTFIGAFIAFAFALAEGEDWTLISVLGAGAALMFLLWLRENHMAMSAANAVRPSRTEMRALRMMPVQVVLVLLYVVAVQVSVNYAPGLSGFVKGALQSLPIGLLAGWLVAFVYIIIESDEMVRRMQTIATAMGAGATLVAATGWGLVAMHAGLPDFASVFLFPAFAVFYTLASVWVTRRFA
ncbi:MAG: hypothetical protein LAT81_04710 [Oceanicaulis sp.]|nr:hypothetical protein [Oceanicaulis sp.]